jgi:hypothetical protein
LEDFVIDALIQRSNVGDTFTLGTEQRNRGRFPIEALLITPYESHRPIGERDLGAAWLSTPSMRCTSMTAALANDNGSPSFIPPIAETVDTSNEEFWRQANFGRYWTWLEMVGFSLLPAQLLFRCTKRSSCSLQIT